MCSFGIEKDLCAGSVITTKHPGAENAREGQLSPPSALGWWEYGTGDPMKAGIQSNIISVGSRRGGLQLQNMNYKTGSWIPGRRTSTWSFPPQPLSGGSSRSPWLTPTRQTVYACLKSLSPEWISNWR